MRRALIALLALLALVVAAAVLEGREDDDSGIVHRDPKGTLHVEHGKTFVLEFSLKADLGIRWEFARSSSTDLSGTFVDYPTGRRKGALAVKRFRFRADEMPGGDELLFYKHYGTERKERRLITLIVD